MRWSLHSRFPLSSHYFSANSANLLSMTLSCSDCFPLTWVGVAHRSFSFPPITPHTCLPTTYNNHPLTCCSISAPNWSISLPEHCFTKWYSHLQPITAFWESFLFDTLVFGTCLRPDCVHLSCLCVALHIESHVLWALWDFCFVKWWIWMNVASKAQSAAILR